jgi:cyclopropane-fatty-acyl-phospholipid synthase
MTTLLKRIMQAIGRGTRLCFHTTFVDGSAYQNHDGIPAVRLHFKTRWAEWRTILCGHIGMLESYFDQTLEIDGDFSQAFGIAFESAFTRSPGPLVWLRNQWHELRFGNRSIARAKSNARFHYALGADFYGYWLDHPLMMYTCAYWKPGTSSVEEAQRNKIDHVCNKIRLKPGESVVDIGCGFGGFMFRAAEKYGVSVCGINTTSEQVEWVRTQIEQRGLSDRLQAREADLRQVHAQFDKVVSIGVLEHAGRDQLRSAVKAHADFLKPGGLGMLHFIGHVGVRDTEFYIRKHVFPGGWIPSLAQTIMAMEDCGLEIVDIENLRRHYARTLDAWAERFDRHWPDIQALDPERFDERFRRIWRTYLVACAEMFRSANGTTHLFQIVFSKGNINQDNYPMSRAFLYGDDQAVPDAPAAARQPAQV